MKEIKIEKGVELPVLGARAIRYPWRQMEVGDSFFVPNVVGVSGTDAGRRTGWKFTQRIVTESGVKGVRAWRVA